jgi:hypothetical protein
MSLRFARLIQSESKDEIGLMRLEANNNQWNADVVHQGSELRLPRQ